MTTQKKASPEIPIEQALYIAKGIVKRLQPHCVRIDIAGSIRRQRAKVSDIEIICQPQKIQLQKDLFNLDIGTYVPIKAFDDALANISAEVVKGKTSGRQMQIRIIKYDIMLDLFMPQDHDYYRILAIRTGSADYSHQVIANAWKKAGWVGTPDGLRRQSQCAEKGDSYVCHHPDPEKPPCWHSERAFFEWLGVEWILPANREIKSLLNLAQ